jgi:tetratricopeptide (TPR) repeat protein
MPRAKRSTWAQEKLRRLNWSRLRSNEHQLDLRGYVTTATDAENQFLENMPGEIKEVLRWHADAQSRGQASQSIADFAGRFLGGMYEDGAVLPTNHSASAPEVLALVLLQHRSNPRSTGAWLNLGFALRRGALYRTQDPEETNRARLQSAVQAFDRALELDSDNNGKNIRAWTGMSLAYHMLDMYEKELECCARALESDRSDPKLWLLYSFALKSAGREDEALSTMNDAYEAYIRAGKPDELREVFADVQSTTQRPCRQRMAQ